MAYHRYTHSSSSSSSSSVLDDLYCVEEELEDEDGSQSPSLSPLLVLERDLFMEDGELISLFTKEHQTDLNVPGSVFFSVAWREAVEWMLKVKSCYGFSTLTAILSVNYLDRLLRKSPHLHQEDKPWMIQLAAVTCLSLAAKFEEIHVPLLIDLQVEGTKYVFNAKTIQKMELMVLSTLDWRMNPVTPISFLDHIISRLGLKTYLQSEFHRRCEQLLLSIVADSRFLAYLPSVVAAATMLNVIDQLDHFNPLDSQNQLLAVLINISKEDVKHCYDLIVTVSENRDQANPPGSGNKRDREPSHEPPSSPKGVLDAYYLSSESSNDSWALSGGTWSTSPSVSSSPDQRAPKKKRVEELPELCSVIGYVVAISIVRHLVLEELLAFFIVFPLHLWKRY